MAQDDTSLIVITPEIGAPMDVERARRRVSRRFWPKFWTTLGRVPFAEEIAAAWFCATDPFTPTRVKALLLGALLYFIAPLDMIPDFVAVLGFTDDAAVLATTLGVVGAHIKPRHWRRARARLGLPEPAEETPGAA